MADLAKYVVSLEAQTARYERKLDQANRKMDRFQKKTTNSLNRINRSFRSITRIAGTAFAAVAGTGAVALVARTTEIAENLDLVSLRLGVAAKDLQAWQLIAERSGIAANTFNQGLQRVLRRSGEAAAGFGEARDALAELNIDAQRFNDLPLDSKLLQLSAAFQRIEDDETALRLAFKLFDSEGAVFLQFLKEGEDGLKKLRRELDGQIWSDEERTKLTEANQALTELGQNLTLIAGRAAIATTEAAKFVEKLGDLLIQRGLFGSRVAAIANSIQQDPFGIGATAGLNVGQILGGAGAPASTAPFAFPGRTLGGDIASGRAQGPAAPESVARLTPGLEAMVMTTEETAAEMDELIFGVFDQAEERAERFNDLFTRNLVQAADSGFDSLLQSWSRTLVQMAAQFLSSEVFNLLGFGQPGGGFLGLGTLFGGARAAGGPVSAGRSYLVGERGPELFTPASAGMVTPNGAIGGNVFHIDARGATPGMETRIKQAVKEAVATAEFNRAEGRRRSR